MPSTATQMHPPTPKFRMGGLSACIVALMALLISCGPADPEDSPTTPTPITPPPTPDHTPEPRTTESGLTITDLAPGSGDPAPPNAAVTIEFTAWIVGEDTPFDSTERRRRPMSFALDAEGLIPGLRQGIEGMRQGGTRRVEIPAALAYGTTGRHPIPPDADLIYEITLLSWQLPSD